MTINSWIAPWRLGVQVNGPSEDPYSHGSRRAALCARAPSMRSKCSRRAGPNSAYTIRLCRARRWVGPTMDSAEARQGGEGSCRFPEGANAS
jgi:hypothetical protein